MYATDVRVFFNSTYDNYMRIHTNKYMYVCMYCTILTYVQIMAELISL